MVREPPFGRAKEVTPRERELALLVERNSAPTGHCSWHRQISRSQLEKTRVDPSAPIVDRRHCRRWYCADQGSSTTTLATLARRSI